MLDGRCCALYTDGITEAMNEDREKFGMDRLVEWSGGMGAKRLNPARTDSPGRAGAHGRATDDMTLFIIRRK